MERFRDQYDLGDDGWIVATIPEEWAKILGASTCKVVFSEVSFAKNRRHHTDLRMEEYLLLGDIVGKGHLILRDSVKTLSVVYCHIDGQMYHYVLKRTDSGETIFLTSFRRTGEKDIVRLRNKIKKRGGKIIKEGLP